MDATGNMLTQLIPGLNSPVADRSRCLESPRALHVTIQLSWLDGSVPPLIDDIKC
jgi:hypothetical protein